MKAKSTWLLITLLIIACKKESNNILTTAEQSNSATAVLQDRIPLNDLGTGTYQGYIGGLYPNGYNKPSGTYAADLYLTCNNMVPLDVDGKPSTSNGYIVFISMGGSTGGKNMTALI